MFVKTQKTVVEHLNYTNIFQRNICKTFDSLPQGVSNLASGLEVTH